MRGYQTLFGFVKSCDAHVKSLVGDWFEDATIGWIAVEYNVDSIVFHKTYKEFNAAVSEERGKKTLHVPPANYKVIDAALNSQKVFQITVSHRHPPTVETVTELCTELIGGTRKSKFTIIFVRPNHVEFKLPVLLVVPGVELTYESKKVNTPNHSVWKRVADNGDIFTTRWTDPLHLV